MKFFCLLFMLLSSSATAQVFPMPGSADPRLRTIPYDVNRVVALKVATNFQLTVIFGPDERVENVAIGDSAAWQATLNGRADALFIKPIRPNGTTNMTVITDVRVYSFELSPSYGPTPDALFTVRFSYPDADPVPLASTPPPETGRYRLSGYRALRPGEITDDGVRTYIDWRPQQPLPAVFAIDDRGEEVLLDGHMRDGRYVIDGVHRSLLFRLDRQTARANRLGTRNRR